MSERPDAFIIDISKSLVLEIKAGELVVSDQYPTYYTLRFPRMMNIRFDKDWHEAMTSEQLNDLITNFNDARRMNKFKRGLEANLADSDNEESEIIESGDES